MEAEQTVSKPPCCPTCQSSHYVIPIIYGQPTEELMRRWRKNEVELAGSLVINGTQPQWTCMRCALFIYPTTDSAQQKEIPRDPA